MGEFRIIQSDVLAGLATLPDGSVRCCVTSPPYWGLRDYGVDGQMGLEATPAEFIARMVEVFREVRRVLRKDGTCWVNLGDSYCSTAPGTMGDKLNQRGILAGVSDRRAEGSRKPRPLTPSGLKPKDLVGIPWRVAFALQADGWYLRSDIIWHKPNPMPESVTDRPTKAHEYLFLLSKSARYYYDAAAVAEAAVEFSRTPNRPRVDPAERKGVSDFLVDGVSWCGVAEKRNRRSVWTVATQPFREAHFAVMPEALVEPCVLAGSAVGDTVLDPFTGSGTVGVVALRHSRNFVGTEINPAYAKMASNRIYADQPLLNQEAAS